MSLLPVGSEKPLVGALQSIEYRQPLKNTISLGELSLYQVWRRIFFFILFCSRKQLHDKGHYPEMAGEKSDKQESTCKTTAPTLTVEMHWGSPELFQVSPDLEQKRSQSIKVKHHTQL